MSSVPLGFSSGTSGHNGGMTHNVAMPNPNPAIVAAVAALSDDDAMALWRGTLISAIHGRARAMQVKRARRVIAELAPVAGTDHLPVWHWNLAAIDRLGM